MKTYDLPYYRVLGEGEPVLALHCSGGSSSQWLPMMETMAGSHRVMAADLTGHGRSAGWASGEAPTLRGEVARLERLLDGAGEPAHLVGHSYGGAVAIKLALLRPDLVRSLTLYEPVAFVLLSHAAATVPALEEILAVYAMIDSGMQAGRPAQAAAVFIDYWSGVGAWGRLPESARERVAERMPAVAHTFESLLADELRPGDLRRLGVPVLYLRGRYANLPVTAIQAVMREANPEIRHRVLDGLGHMGPVTHPGLVVREVAAFLRTLRRDAVTGVWQPREVIAETG